MQCESWSSPTLAHTHTHTHLRKDIPWRWPSRTEVTGWEGVGVVQLVFRVINSVGAFFKRGRSFSRVFIPDRGEFLTMTDFKSGDFLEKKNVTKRWSEIHYLDHFLSLNTIIVKLRVGLRCVTYQGVYYGCAVYPYYGSIAMLKLQNTSDNNHCNLFKR